MAVLTVFQIKVKEFFPLFIALSTYSLSGNAVHAENKVKYLRVGEQFSIPFSKKSQFSVGNKRILKTKFLKSKKRLLIKGIKQGLSDLLIWEQSKSKQYQIYVSHYGSQLKQQSFIDLLNYKQVKFIQKNNYLILEEPISERDFAIQTIHFCKENVGMHCEAQMSLDLKTQLITDARKILSSDNIQNLKCSITGVKLICNYNASSKLNLTQLQTQFVSEFNIRLLNQSLESSLNYKVVFHFLEKQSLFQKKLNLGGSIIDSQLSSLLSSKPQEGVFHNAVSLQQGHAQLKTVATPVFYTTLDIENTVKIGSEDAFTNSTSYSQQTNWKFSGFELKFKLYKKKSQLVLEYTTTMSSRNGDSIEGHQKASSLIVTTDKPSNLFSIELKDQLNNNDRLPRISSLPIIGRIFRAKTKALTKTKLLGFFLVEPQRI